MNSRFSYGLKGYIAVTLMAVSLIAAAATFNLYSPANGIQKNTGSTYVNTAAASSDVTALWSGTCNGSSFLRGDGACATPAAGGSVSSVALTAPSIFTVTGSPVTTSGTLGLVAAGTSGGVPYFDSSTTLASSAALTANRLVLGGGAGAAPTVLGSLGTTTTLLHGNGAGAPTFGAVSLTADVSGTLPAGNGGTGVTSLGTLSKADDTNVTMTLGGTPAGSLITSTSMTLGWTGTLSVPRGGIGVGTVSGVLKGNGTSAVGSAASSDVIALWSGSCSSSTFLRGDGSCQTPAGGTMKFAAANITSTPSSCTVNRNPGTGFGSCTYNSAGNVTLFFTGSYFSGTPVCTATDNNGGNDLLVKNDVSGTSNVNITTAVMLTGSPGDGIMNITCTGT